MSVPDIKQTLTGYNFKWTDEQISIMVSGLSFKHDSLKGEIQIKRSLPGNSAPRVVALDIEGQLQFFLHESKDRPR